MLVESITDASKDQFGKENAYMKLWRNWPELARKWYVERGDDDDYKSAKKNILTSKLKMGHIEKKYLKKMELKKLFIDWFLHI